MTAPAATGTAAGGVPTGNAFDKYGCTHPVVRRLMAGFDAALDDLFRRAAPASVLDVGCGEGVLTARWAARIAPGEVVGVDLADPRLAAEWSARAGPAAGNLRFEAMDATRLTFGDGAFELAAATEVLEHVSDPAAALAELARVARRWLLVSVPREPLWRALNVARGAYLGQLGNTPGHLHHWTRDGLRRLIAPHGEIVAVRTPPPWTLALVRVG